MAKKANTGGLTKDYRHATEKRTNIPPAKIASEGETPKVAKARYAYSPHLPPVLRFDATGKADRLSERIEALLAKSTKQPLTEFEAAEVRDALRVQQPWLEWAGKREQHERGFFEVDPVALHIHERVSAQACIRSAMREDVQRDLFADPQQPYREAVQFYKHDVEWANRLILGDSLEVMSSLARRENLAGKVQMIYMDPPYGIKFASNFQPEVGKKDIREGEADLSRELEVVRAFRDTWNLGIHSYAGYLRDRLFVARDLLTNSGSLFVQISDENLHRVRQLLDDVFGPRNFVSQITIKKTAGSTADFIPGSCDYLLWYAKEKESALFRPLFFKKNPGEEGATGYRRALLRDGQTVMFTDSANSSLPARAEIFAGDNVTSQSVGRQKGEGAASWFAIEIDGRSFTPGPRARWKSNEEGMLRLKAAERLIGGDRTTLSYRRCLSDFLVTPLLNVWTDTVGQNQLGGEKVFVVQTALKVVERCLLMTSEPGDLVLDPTCGSGTSAVVAEQWGRRWITIDTSRVALSIARQRILTSNFDHHRTRGGPLTQNDQAENPASGFAYKTVPHITLKSIAQNSNLDPIFEKHEPKLNAALKSCNAALGKVSEGVRRKLANKALAKQKAEGKRSLTDADRRRWELPAKAFEHWTVPFDTDPEWPTDLAKAVTAYRASWRAKMDEVNACIEANADQEELVDQPEIVRGVVRVSGPFTVEGVRPEELSLGEEGLFDGTLNEFEDDDEGPDPRLVNTHAYLTKMVQSLRADGLTFLNNKRRKFARLDPLFEDASGSVLHAEGVWDDGDADGPATVAITFGPQYGPVTAQQVEDAIRAAKRYDELVVAGFSFDAEASAVVEESQHPKLRIHASYIRPDLNPGMDGLLKETPGSQLFTVFGQPEVAIAHKGGEWVVTLKGVDIYDPIANAVRSTGADKVAAWFLDQDYDGRCFCITQAFFPDQNAWEKIAKALKSSADPEAFAAFSGTKSLPFAAGKHKSIAVKVIDPRGNEVMAIRKLEA